MAPLPAPAPAIFRNRIATLSAIDYLNGMNPSDRYRSLWSRKERLYRALYEFTYGSCGACVESGCACKDRICQHVEEQARKRGFEFRKGTHPVLRFIGERGCVVPPHLRETCTIFLCAKAQEKPSFERKSYARLKSLCERVDWKLMELEEAHGLKALLSDVATSFRSQTNQY